MSRTHHLVWRRGFAPLFFILTIALIVVAVGSGIYFSSLETTVQVPDSGNTAVDQALDDVATNATTSTAAPVLSDKRSFDTQYDCGEESEAATQCLAKRIKSCLPSTGLVTDPSSGISVKRVIDGYVDGKCSYRSTITSGEGDFSMLVGLTIDCLLPKEMPAAKLNDGALVPEDLLTYCSGSFIDLLREQMGTPVAQ